MKNRKYHCIISLSLFLCFGMLYPQDSKGNSGFYHPAFATVFENALRKQNAFIVYSVFREHYTKNNIYYLNEKKNIEEKFFKPFGKDIKYVNVEVLQMENNQMEISFSMPQNRALDQKVILTFSNNKEESTTQLFSAVLDLISKFGEEEK